MLLEFATKNYVLFLLEKPSVYCNIVNKICSLFVIFIEYILVSVKIGKKIHV